MSWINLPRALRREIESKVKRGPTQEEVAREKSRPAPKAKPVDQVAADAEAANVVR